LTPRNESLEEIVSRLEEGQDEFFKDVGGKRVPAQPEIISGISLSQNNEKKTAYKKNGERVGRKLRY
jgi:hypothetical protein